MTDPLPKFQPMIGPDGDQRFLFMCPGCGTLHQIRTAGPPGLGPIWQFNNDVLRPSVYPSVLITRDEPFLRCHSFIEAGMIRYLDDCHHKLRASTVEIPAVSTWHHMADHA